MMVWHPGVSMRRRIRGSSNQAAARSNQAAARDELRAIMDDA